MTQSLITSTDKKINDIKDILTPVLRRLLKDDRDAQAIIEAENVLQDCFARVVIYLLAKLYVVTVDYTRTLSKMIEAGKFGYVNNGIVAEGFPTTGAGKHDLEVLLICFGKHMESDNVLAEFDKLGLRAATLPELLAFSETHPDIQRQFPIIALGSVSRHPDGFRHVPSLGGWSGERGLFLDWFEDGWHDYCRFAAVRK